MKLSIDFNKPIGNGIITCLNSDQAIVRSKTKGSEAAMAVIEVLKNEQKFKKNSSPRVKIIQKIYGSLMNPDEASLSKKSV